MHKAVKFCVRHDESKVSDVITQMGGMRQGCGFSTYFFNRLTDINYVSKTNLCAQTAGKVTIPDLLYTGILAVTSLIMNGLQRAKDQMDKEGKVWA
jgi:hypothetical protein